MACTAVPHRCSWPPVVFLETSQLSRKLHHKEKDLANFGN